MVVTQEDAQRITAFLHITAEADRADLAFVFGTRLPDPAVIAAQLYAAGTVPTIVLTGGINRLTGHPEAQTHFNLLRTAGVPAERLIVEAASTNTLENVTLALPLIRARIDLAVVESVIVVAKWMHCRRAIMTLKRHFPPGIRYFTRTYHPDGITPDNWFLDENRAAPVLKNWRNIPRYLEWGHLAEIEFVDGAFV